MRSWLILWGVILAILLGGSQCQQQPPPTPEVITVLTLAEACSAYSGALEVLTPLRAQGKLSADQIATVDRVNRTTDVLCGAGGQVIVDAVAQVESATTALMHIFAEERGGA